MISPIARWWLAEERIRCVHALIKIIIEMLINRHTAFSVKVISTVVKILLHWLSDIVTTSGPD